MKYSFWTSLFMAVFFLGACGGGGSESPGVGNTDTDVTDAEVEVGKLIFEDARLSANNNQACATCHAAAAGFADPDVTASNPVSEGSIAGEFGERNAPTSAYAMFSPSFALISIPDGGSNYAGGQFIDGRRNTLEEQAKDPFLNAVEMANADKQAVVDKIRNGPYADKFLAVYGSNVFDNTVTAYDRIAQAIAAFERSDEMNPFNSKFDCYLLDATQFPLSTLEQAGLDVFDNTGKCSACHTLEPDSVSGKVLFTNFQYFNIGVPSNPNNPANLVNAGFIDLGLGGRLSGTAENGKFKTPTLRNVELTAPYMHNGVFNTLEEVVAFYNIEEKASAIPPPEVSNDINTDVDFLGLNEPDDIDALVAFMKTLTDGSGIGVCF
jgi:cytochrome c peroxidase